MKQHIGQKIYATDRIRAFADITTEWKVAAISDVTQNNRGEHERIWRWFGEFASNPESRRHLQRNMVRDTPFSPEPELSAVQGTQLTEAGEKWHLYVRFHPYAGQRKRRT